jgi:hypothetical protein
VSTGLIIFILPLLVLVTVIEEPSIEPETTGPPTFAPG